MDMRVFAWAGLLELSQGLLRAATNPDYPHLTANFFHREIDDLVSNGN